MLLSVIKTTFAKKETVVADENNLRIQYSVFNEAGESVVVDDWTQVYHRLDLNRLLETAQNEMSTWQNFDLQSRIDAAQDEIDRINGLLDELDGE